MPGVADSTIKSSEIDEHPGFVIILMNIWCYGLLALWTLVGILLFPFAFVLSLLLLRWSPPVPSA